MVFKITLFETLILGVPRETQEEKEIADFDIFDDPESPFSTFNFQYPNQAFKRLHDLMYFNTLNNINVSISDNHRQCQILPYNMNIAIPHFN